MTERDLHTIWHEAGHAVAVFLQGGKVDLVSARDEPDRWAGICTWRRHGDSCLTCDPIAGSVVALAGKVAENSLTVHAATRALERADRLKDAQRDTGTPVTLPDVGAAEQALHELRESDSAGNLSDEERVNRYIASVTSSWSEAAALLLWLRTRTVELVASRKFAALHARLVDLLIAHGHVDGPTAMVELAQTARKFDRAKRDVDRFSGRDPEPLAASEPLA